MQLLLLQLAIAVVFIVFSHFFLLVVVITILILLNKVSYNETNSNRQCLSHRVSGHGYHTMSGHAYHTMSLAMLITPCLAMRLFFCMFSAYWTYRIIIRLACLYVFVSCFLIFFKFRYSWCGGCLHDDLQF